MESNRTISGCWLLLAVGMALAGTAVSILTNSWLPAVWALGIILGLFLIGLLVSAIFGLVFAPMLWLAGKTRPPHRRT